jgi:hypothetical protein
MYTHSSAQVLFARKTYAPDIDEDSYPPVVQVKSVHNTPIEGCWRWFLKTQGRDFKDTVKSGLQEGIYTPGNQLHMHVVIFIPV